MRQANPNRKIELRKAVKEARLQATRIDIKRPMKKAGAIGKVARFSSLAELRADFVVSGCRDAFVAGLVKNHGSTPDRSRKGNEGDNDGVIYAIICRVDLKVYVGQTKNYDVRMRQHFGGNGGSQCLTSAINEHGRENFVSVILLAGIEQQKELDSTEMAVIRNLDCVGPGGYNLLVSGRGIPNLLPIALTLTCYP